MGRIIYMSFTEKIIVMIIATIIHEVGHVLGALITGIKVSEFSIGFGPVIKEFTIKGTTYKLSWILLGGYVKTEREDEEFLTYPRISRMILTASGLIMSIFILPIACLIVLDILQNKELNIFSQFINMFSAMYYHPLNYFYQGIGLFPIIPFTNKVYTYLSFLGDISLFFGITNLIPIPVTDGGQLLMGMFENKFPTIKTNSLKFMQMGYLVIFIIMVLPMFIVFAQNIKTTWWIFVIVGYVIYRFIKL